MSDSDLHLPPLDPEAEALLRYERERPRVDSARAGRMWSAIAAELAASAVPGTAQAVPAPPGANPLPSALATTGKLAILKALPWVAVSLSLGGAGGFVAGQKLARSTSAGGSSLAATRTTEPGSATLPAPPAPLVAVPIPQASAVQAPTVLPVPPAARTPARPSTTPPTPLSHPTPAPMSAAVDDLTAEAAIVARAESALRMGDWAAALAQSDAYARRFPKGQLAEEAAYLGIRACEGAGDKATAQRRLSDFRRRFPQSPLGD